MAPADTTSLPLLDPEVGPPGPLSLVVPRTMALWLLLELELKDALGSVESGVLGLVPLASNDLTLAVGAPRESVDPGLGPPAGLAEPLLPRELLVGAGTPGGTMLPASLPKMLTKRTTTLWPARLLLMKLTTLLAALMLPVLMLLGPPVLSLAVLPPVLA